MPFSSYVPASPVGNFVERFWESTYTPTHSRVKILPSGTLEIIINLSEDRIRIYDSRKPEKVLSFPGIVIAGPYAGVLSIDPMQDASMLGIHFKPGGAFRMFGAAVRELANTHLALEDLWGASAIELREKLCAAATPQKRFEIMENTLKARLKSSLEHPVPSLALGIFGPVGNGETVRAAAKLVGLSERRFIQVFTDHVGLTPKLFCRVLRFQHARRIMEKSAAVNWAHVAVSSGYYDQSHLIRDFQQFSGFCPTAYLSQRSNPLFPNLVIDH